jgi:2-oxoglutarate dehydrogenase complex dehydrogenase (E1) component-like enzyme
MCDGQYPLSLGYLETLYQVYLQDANRVSNEWREYFATQASVPRAPADPVAA